MCDMDPSPEAHEDWQTYKTSVSTRTGHLLDSGLYSDATLAVGPEEMQEEFKVHKNILAMSSPVFEAMFYGSLPENSTVQITDIKPDTFRCLLQYIYKDLLDLWYIVDAWDLWYAANKYLLKHLSKKCLEFIEKEMTNMHVIYTLERAMDYNLLELENKCLRYIDIHADIIKAPVHLNETYSFLRASKESVIKIISRPLLSASEVEIFNAVREWGTASLQRNALPLTTENLREQVACMLPYIHFDYMSPDDFMNLVVPSGLLTAEQLNDNLLILMRKLLPSPKETTFRKFAAQVCCERGTIYSRCSQIEKSDHYLKFKVYTTYQTCILTGLRVAKAHTDSPCMFCQREQYLHQLHNDHEPVVLEEDDTERNRLPVACSVYDCTEQRLAHFEGSLNSVEYDVDFSTPVPLKNGSIYTICVKVLETVSLTCCCRGNCKQKVNCGDLTVEFYSDPRSLYTNVNTGLVSHLYFYVPKNASQMSGGRSTPALISSKDQASSQPLDLKCDRLDEPSTSGSNGSGSSSGSGNAAQPFTKRMRLN